MLVGEVQTLWTVFRLSIMQQFDYWLQLVPQEGEGLSYTFPLEPEVIGLRGRSFQSLLSSHLSSVGD